MDGLVLGGKVAVSLVVGADFMSGSWGGRNPLHRDTSSRPVRNLKRGVGWRVGEGEEKEPTLIQSCSDSIKLHSRAARSAPALTCNMKCSCV